ncbi:MAG: cytochrome, partial [Rhodobacteraceae bacterium]|nr:cytochrome [Paracoccaceae bacterium]
MPQPPAAYDATARGLHWLTAATIAALVPMGLVAAGLPEETSAEILAKARLLSLHKTLGV